MLFRSRGIWQPEIRVCSKNGMKIISIPRFPSGNFFDNWKVVNRVFRLFVPDSLENVEAQ